MLMRIADFFLTIPSLPLMIVLAAYVRVDSAPTMALILSITAWAGLSRAIRAQVLSLKEREFIEAAKVLGLRKSHIIFRELLPNMGSYIATNAILAFTGAMYAQVGLFFLGVVPFSSLNWGVMLNFAVSQGGALYTLRSVHYLLAPIVCIVLLQTGAVLFARAMEILFNPRLRVR
ncbi:MAG: ABC transporter permease [Firmicutes bacterium]|nr:ABC transporter permease [Bacillota bacterium]